MENLIKNSPILSSIVEILSNGEDGMVKTNLGYYELSCYNEENTQSISEFPRSLFGYSRLPDNEIQIKIKERKYRYDYSNVILGR